MRRFIKLVISNAKISVRNWQALFWMFMFPLIIMSLLGIVFGGGDQKAKLGIVDNDHSKLSKKIVDGFEDIDSIDLNKGTKSKEMKLIRNGKVDAVVIIEKGFSKHVPKPTVKMVTKPMESKQPTANKNMLPNMAAQPQVLVATPKITYKPKKPAKIELHYDPSNAFASAMIRTSIKAIFGKMEQKMSNTQELFKVTEKREAAKGLDFIDFLLPGIIAMAIMSNCVFGLSSTIVTYREKGILRRLKITPLPLSAFLGARIVTQVCISFLQAAFLIVFARLVFGVQIIGSYYYLAAVVLVGSLCFINIGFLVSSVANSTETADTIGNIVTMPMMFLSGIFFNVDFAPSWIQPLIRILPLKFLADALRDISVRGKSLSQVQNNLYILLGLTAVFFALAIIFFKWEDKTS